VKAGHVDKLAGRVVLFPGLVPATTVLAVNMLGDGLRDKLDPHSQTTLNTHRMER
jgi:ABC-type dipeptide/oligopeptide/nickel transport system permease subunit